MRDLGNNLRMKYSSLFFMFFLVTTITAQNNFEPCSSVLTNSFSNNSYLLKTAQQIHPEKNEEVIASIYTDPSLIPVSKFLYIALNKDSDGFLVLKEFSYSHENLFTDKYSKTLTKEEFKLLRDLFTVALIHVEYQPKQTGTHDGTSYHLQCEFWATQKLCGFTHSPTEGNVVDFLRIIKQLEVFTKSPDNFIPEELVLEVEELTRRINRKKLNLVDPTFDQVMNGNYEFFHD
jgi:hypothetical protein